MFSGIVESTGVVVDVDDAPAGRRVTVAADVADALEHGQSLAVSGACLTVERVHESGSWDAAGVPTEGIAAVELFLSTETLERTYLGSLAVGDRVNLERALAADGRFDGHLVQGHVDAVGTVTRIESIGEDWTFGFSLPDSLARYVVEKGSIAVDGISLTVSALEDPDGGPGAFTTAVIPTTYADTTLSEKAVGDPVHLEVDVVAKYVERLTQAHR